MRRGWCGGWGRVIDECGLTQEGRVSVTQRESLVAGNAEGGERVEALVQERLQAGGGGIGWVEQVVDLLAGRAQGGHWRTEDKKLVQSNRNITSWMRPNRRLI